MVLLFSALSGNNDPQLNNSLLRIVSNSQIPMGKCRKEKYILISSLEKVGDCVFFSTYVMMPSKNRLQLSGPYRHWACDVRFHSSQALMVQDGPLDSLSGFFDHTHIDTVGLLWTSDQPVAETSTYTGQHNIDNKRQASIPREGFEPATPASKRPQTYALGRAATRIGRCLVCNVKIAIYI
jgi:hypothetical protein